MAVSVVFELRVLGVVVGLKAVAVVLGLLLTSVWLKHRRLSIQRL